MDGLSSEFCCVPDFIRLYGGDVTPPNSSSSSSSGSSGSKYSFENIYYIFFLFIVSNLQKTDLILTSFFTDKFCLITHHFEKEIWFIAKYANLLFYPSQNYNANGNYEFTTAR